MAIDYIHYIHGFIQDLRLGGKFGGSAQTLPLSNQRNACTLAFWIPGNVAGMCRISSHSRYFMLGMVYAGVGGRHMCKLEVYTANMCVTHRRSS